MRLTPTRPKLEVLRSGSVMPLHITLDSPDIWNARAVVIIARTATTQVSVLATTQHKTSWTFSYSLQLQLYTHY